MKRSQSVCFITTQMICKNIQTFNDTSRKNIFSTRTYQVQKGPKQLFFANIWNRWWSHLEKSLWGAIFNILSLFFVGMCEIGENEYELTADRASRQESTMSAISQPLLQWMYYLFAFFPTLGNFTSQKMFERKLTLVFHHSVCVVVLHRKSEYL